MKRNTVRGLVAIAGVLLVSVGAVVAVQGCAGGDAGGNPFASDDSGVIVDAGSSTDAATYDAALCPTAQADCNGSCATLSRDPYNCGACGVTCDAGAACNAGACTTSCGGAQTLCTVFGGVDGGTSYCATLASDNENCGACTTACGAGRSCVDGHCVASCAPPDSLCGADGGMPYCTNFRTDNQNCNGCGKICDPGQVCSDSKCGTTCAVDLLKCDESCIDPQTSVTNCGASGACDVGAGTAGEACGVGQACVAGQCVYQVGSYNVNSGANYNTHPTAYSCVAACALLFGAGNYACSTINGTLNHLAWGSIWASAPTAATAARARR